MADFEFGDRDLHEQDRLLPEEEEETSFVEPFQPAENELPPWAAESELVGSAGDETTGKVSQFNADLVKYPQQPSLDFRVKDNGALYVRWGHKWVRLTVERDPTRFLSSATIQKTGGAQLARALGLIPELGPRQQAALAQATQVIPTDSQVESIPLHDLSATAHDAETAVKELASELPLRELQGLDEALQRTRGELVNNLAKLTALDEHIAMEKRKLGEAGDEFSRRRIASMLRDLQDERSSRLEAASANREALRGQISRVRETVNRLLNEDTTLADRLRTLFREQGITIASIVTALGFIISTLVLAVTGSSAGSAPPAAPADKQGLKDWVKKQLTHLASALSKLAGKAIAALPGVIGTVVAWLLRAAGAAAGWLAQNLWAFIVAVAGLLVVYIRS